MRVQTDNGLGDLIFVVTAAILLILLIRLGWLILRRRKSGVTLSLFAATVFVYAGALVITGLMAPETDVAPGTAKCSDEWCVTVTGATQQAAIGDFKPAGRLIIVDVQVSSESRGRAQRGSNPAIWLIDDSGAFHAPSAAAQAALEKAAGPQPPLDELVPPGGVFTTRQAFDVARSRGPVRVLIEERPGITHFILFNEEAPFSGKTVFKVLPKL